MIKINNISKKYKNKAVVNNATFEINKGMCTALIGPNGAGKSTLIDILIGDRHPTSGSIDDNEALLNEKHLGIMFQKTIFPELIKVKELYNLFSSMYKNPISYEQFSKITRFSENKMSEFANRLSGGQKRILDFGLALIGNPKFLILDEPTSAMDVQMRQHFWDIVDGLKAQGVTILYTSHYIEEVERMADRVVVIESGEIVMNDSPNNLKANQHNSIIKLPLKHQYLQSQFNHNQMTRVKDSYEIQTDNVNQAVQILLNAEVDLNEIEITKTSLLESIFSNNKEESL
ncbi:ABC transporter ATP-binding protein [Staphylococcus sp. 18_1_E_LY]|uniref:ABC transporter ATP-binding protein n=1 Tax=Staphylococcus lloydii TaxID=2781774 RepID=A0A7T1AY18_9STAP|nr:ABC transporter ATP-binding protein [Staphylococcus lloydii]MBF7018808.1 ABC transporter ATP-binding protein [Staphylococcus lloydii]MBF7026536.1 ABC transporter ATP-binding protein [Staphylococcus lloydii]QPM74203.1 ABC transporter ATP-binding protein [Staphylococcus lloydii]